MGAVPGDIETDQQPPMTVPLRHFVVGFGLLVGGLIVGLGLVVGVAPAHARLVHVHLLLAGWVCVTIMGAMTQFVPVWSGTRLHSRRLAVVQLWLVVVGLVGFAASLFAGRPSLLAVGAAPLVAGFWVFVYNLGRTLAGLEAYDVTETHFAIALGFFLLVTALGYVLALDFRMALFAGLPISRTDVVGAHATLAVFGAIVTTALGALYQLATMFTQTELHGIDTWIRRFETVGYPSGVLALAAGRLVGSAPLARLGGLLVASALLGFSVLLARRLHETRVDWTPMLSRYAVLAVATAVWATFALPAWMATPLDPRTLLGAPGTTHLLLLGVVGFLLTGTLYHVVPFIVWVHRYSDLLGLAEVPMIDDLYDDRLAAADFALTTLGTAVLVGADLVTLPPAVTAVGGALVVCGFVLCIANLLSVIHEHSPHSLRAVLLGGHSPAQTGEGTAVTDTSDG